MNDESVLRRIARESIANGMLPRHSPKQTWGGPGTGAQCALCGASIDKHELEFEVEFGVERLHLHLPCYSVWDSERRARRAPAVPSERAADTALAASPSDRNAALPDRHADGKMVGDGGERAYKPGAA